MSRKEKLLQEYSEKIGGYDNMTIQGFLNFLVDKIEKLENPVIEVQIPVKGGDTNGNSKEKQSETPQE